MTMFVAVFKKSMKPDDWNLADFRRSYRASYVGGESADNKSAR